MFCSILLYIFVLGFSMQICGAQPINSWPGATVHDKIVLLRAVFPHGAIRELEEYCDAEGHKRMSEVAQAERDAPTFPARFYIWSDEAEKERMRAAEAFYARLREKYNAYTYFDALAVYVAPFSMCAKALAFVNDQCAEVLHEMEGMSRIQHGSHEAVAASAQKADTLLQKLLRTISYVQHHTLQRMRTWDRTQREPLPPVQQRAVDDLSVFKLHEQMWREWERRQQSGGIEQQLFAQETHSEEQANVAEVAQQPPQPPAAFGVEKQPEASGIAQNPNLSNLRNPFTAVGPIVANANVQNAKDSTSSSSSAIGQKVPGQNAPGGQNMLESFTSNVINANLLAYGY